ncbi:MAG: ribonuclease III [Candidatus Doudnabacteria bacterium RIFCSPHIGHO2_01_FULL_50_11]|uniref:Ribonuclease 3 n=1 Tax=Candidatus Doudnabacteria bacterium RIFCSPHIGHO2_01_FULL_50_11 TaxID=1817828 RepID=A0A1F5PI94_9BACT|nr:MAG: ribonuclease III [Candidatus Doudnabacteria bacterium RIFCSPHIGHO2_01_FULL_50_11]HLC45187.1 ribonuclease III [Patescibacteria group bacterium]
MDLNALEAKLQFVFKNKDILRTALTHRSYLNEHRNYPLPNNERLEFLGDAVLELAVTGYLYENYPNPEGELTNLRSALVNYRMLSAIAGDCDLESHLLLSRGEAKDAGRARQVILANAMEAVIGAMFLDGGYDRTHEFIKRHVLTKLPEVIATKSYIDPKSHLQELVQEKSGITPAYQVLSEVGPDHNKVFTMGVYIGSQKVGEGTGPSKQEAEVTAAEAALKEGTWKQFV